MTFPQYLRQLAADHRESGTTATAEDYEEAARRIETAGDVLDTVAQLAAGIADEPLARDIVARASITAQDLEAHT